MRRFLTVVLVLAVPVSQGWSVGSGAYTIQAVGSKASGMGYAFTAVADDPSAIFFNPAGLTQDDSPAVSLGASPIRYPCEYKADDGTSDAMRKSAPVVPYGYATAPLKGGFWAGIGVNSPFGLGTNWRDDGPLRYSATYSKLQFILVNPVVAYKFGDKISVGGGVAYAEVRMESESMINQATYPDGKVKFGGDGHGWGWNFGVLVKPVEGHQIGLSYRSAVKTYLQGDFQSSNLDPGLFHTDAFQSGAKGNVDFPSSLLLGYAWRPGPWTVALDGEWVRYSVDKQINLSFSETDPFLLRVLNADNPIRREWRDTWNVGAGANYRFNKTWAARGGLLFLPRVVPENTWEPSIPDSAKMGYTLGGGYTLRGLTVDLAYNFFDFYKRTVHNSFGAGSHSTVNGSYKTTAHILSLGLTYRFKTCR